MRKWLHFSLQFSFWLYTPHNFRIVLYSYKFILLNAKISCLCVKLTLRHNTFFSAVKQKGLQDMLIHKSLCLVFLYSRFRYRPVRAVPSCHLNKDPLSRHSSGDSPLSNCLAEELTEKWQPWKVCPYIYVQPVRWKMYEKLTRLCSTACVVKEVWICVSVYDCWPPRVRLSVCAVHLPAVHPRRKQT